MPKPTTSDPAAGHSQAMQTRRSSYSLARGEPSAERIAKWALVGAAVMAALAPSPARADDKAAAESLFEFGRRLMQQGKVAEACPKFAESHRLEPALGTLLNLAHCHDAAGKHATAWAEYKEALLLARQHEHANRVAFAEEQLQKLEPRLVRMAVQVEEAVPGLVVTRNGVELGSGAFGVPIAVDPGQYVITAKAPGYAGYTTHTSATKEGETVSVLVPRLEAVGSGAPPPKAHESTTKAAPATSNEGSGQRTLGFVLGGVGLASLAVGSVSGVMTMNKVSDAENDPALCPEKRCTPRGRAELDDAETLGLISTITFAGGFAALGVGSIFVLTAPGASSERATLALTPVVTPSLSGLNAAGRF